MINKLLILVGLILLTIALHLHNKPVEANPTKNIGTAAFLHEELVGLGNVESGDHFVAASNRPAGSQNIGLGISSPIFWDAMDQLDDYIYGTSNPHPKVIVFSAIDDLELFLHAIPCEVRIVGYNLEGGISPSSEFSAPETSLNEFADIVHAPVCNRNPGRLMYFAPIHSILDSWVEDNPQNLDWVPNVDGVTYQAQNLYEGIGESLTVNKVMSVCNALQDADPVNFKVTLTIDEAFQTTSEAISAFNQMWDCMTHAHISIINGPNAAEDVDTVIQGIR